MKQLSLLLILLTVSDTCYSQHAAISLDKQNIAYVGLDNPITIAAFQYPCKMLLVTAGNGTIDKGELDCSFKLRFNQPGLSLIKIGVKKGKDTLFLGALSVRVMRIPDPVAVVAGKTGGIIRKNVLAVQLGVAAELQGFMLDVRFEVTNYTFHTIRGGKLLIYKDVQGAYFDEEIKKYLSQLQPADRVYITGIKVKGPDGQIRPITAIEFTIDG